ncbi:MAG: MBL fold metallo-hydrolase [Betaproteobacteria bacterium]|nr:MBL fold metallo-hydrolase [Betaproteobacteria bacterium]
MDAPSRAGAMAMLPPTVRVIVRGWLNCNQIVLRAPGANVLVDSGYCTHAQETLRLVDAALEGEGLAGLVNTHCHSDHMGGNAAIAARYDCSVSIPEGEVKHIVPWTPQSVWMAQFDQQAVPFEFHDTIAAGQSFEAGGLHWDAHAAPGHDMDALMFFNPLHRILISGDALWENGMGFVWPEEGANPHIEAALEALATVERLAPAVVIPGHGIPFADSTGAIAVARSRLEAFARDPAKNARHVVKVMFVYALLDKGGMPASDVAAYLDRIPCYRRLAERFLALDAVAMARWLLGDLEKSGAVRISGGRVWPTAAA